MVKLEQNYRSTKTIVEAANSIIEKKQSSTQKARLDFKS
ncbi:3'-5' exonuclease [Algoriphagus boritolerans]